MIYGPIQGGQKLVLRSLMPENGVIFSDGIEADYLAFSSGMVASIGVAAKRGILVT